MEKKVFAVILLVMIFFGGYNLATYEFNNSSSESKELSGSETKQEQPNLKERLDSKESIEMKPLTF